jgi:hypothetical protein
MNQDGIPDSEQHSTTASDELSDKHWINFGHSPFAALLFYNTIFVLVAAAFVWIEPVAGGSGVPEIKCYMNGIDLPRIVDFKTLICRVAGVTFSVASGLPVGKEGPMIHSGSVVAAVISQGRTKFWGVDTSFAKFSDFRNDREKRGECITACNYLPSERSRLAPSELIRVARRTRFSSPSLPRPPPHF